MTRREEVAKMLEDEAEWHTINEYQGFSTDDVGEARELVGLLKEAAALLRAGDQEPHYEVTGPMHVVCQCDACKRAAPVAGDQEGWVSVPREPTDEMLDAGHSAGDFHIMHYDGTDKPGTPRYSLRRSWEAMLSAAPSERT